MTRDAVMGYAEYLWCDLQQAPALLKGGWNKKSPSVAESIRLAESD